MMVRRANNTLTTTFIISSDDSLNRPSSLSSTSSPSTCGQSSDNSENMSTTTTTSVSDSNTDQSYWSQSSTNSSPINNMTITNGKHRLSSQPMRSRFSMLPPQPIVIPPQTISMNIQDKCYDSFENFKNPNSIQSANSCNNNEFKFNDTQLDDDVECATGIHVKNDIIDRNRNRTIRCFNANQSSKFIQMPLELNISNNLVKTFNKSPNNKVQMPHDSNNIQRLPTSSSLDSSATLSLMSMNVKAMLLHGLSSEEVMRNWLQSLACERLIENFVTNGYDIHLMTKMTPQDLAAIGCKCPELRKKLLTEIRKLNLDYELPEYCHMSLEQWLDKLNLNIYHTLLLSEGYDTVEKVCQLTWEDLEEIGFTKLGHQKRLLLGIEKVKKSLILQEERKNDSAIYDVHPNHRVSLDVSQLNSKLNTMGRVRSVFFQTRSGAKLDHRGLPMSSKSQTHIQSPTIGTVDNNNFREGLISDNFNNSDNQIRSNNNGYGVTMTTQRNPPPLPPIRTNSLKYPQVNLEQPIYDNNYSIISAQMSNTTVNQPPVATSNTARFPPASNPAAAGLSQRLSQQPIAQAQQKSIMPIREAPMPPYIPNYALDKTNNQPSNLAYPQQSLNNYQSSIIYQIGELRISNDDEFPPPPPPP